MQIREKKEAEPDNPYASSNAITESVTSPIHEETVDFVPIMRRWNRLRLYYNAILVVWVLSLTFLVFPHKALLPEFWTFAVVGGCVTNLCFTIAPTIEGYGRYYRVWNQVMTTLLFLAGLLFTGLGATVFVATF